MKTDYTHLTVVLDRSGSMQSMRDDAIGGFNAFLSDQQREPGTATLTLVQFDDQYEKPYEFAPLFSVRPLDQNSFVPRGSTALLDAIGRAIDETGERLARLAEPERPAKVLVVILTDGMENASRQFSRQQIFDKITHQTTVYGWQFAFLAANQDAIQTGGQLGIDAGSSATFAADGAGQRAAMAAFSQATSKYRKAPPAAPAAKREFFDAEDRATVEQRK